jgi:outer membrane protein assembly factor BamE
MIGIMQITTLGVRSTLSVAICLLVLAGCVYEMPIQQGNFIDATSLVQVKKGMTRAQVRYLLGTPMVPGGFDNDRWDYDYYLKLRQLKAPRRARAAVYFQNDVVDHVDSDVMPVASDVADRPPASTPVSPPTAPPPSAPQGDQSAPPAGSPAVAAPPPSVPEGDPSAAPAGPAAAAPASSTTAAPPTDPNLPPSP